MHFALARLVVTLAIVAVGSDLAAQTQNKPREPKPSQNRSIVRLSYIPGNFALPVLVGIEHGHFAREGLSVSPVPVTDEGVILRSLATGGTDFAISSQSELISLVGNKIEARVVASAGRGREIDLVAPIWDKSVKSLPDLKGKTVLLLNGVHNFDAVPELYRALALSKPRLRLSDVRVRFINLADLKSIMDVRSRPTYAKWNIGALLMFREFTAGYVDEMKARVVMSGEDIGKLIGRRGVQPLFASKLVLTRNPKTVQRFVRAWARTLRYLSDPANKAAVVHVMQIYYLRQYGYPLKRELAAKYVAGTRYDHVVWTEHDIAEANINAKAMSAARNLLFTRIKDSAKRPFQSAVTVDNYIDMSFAKKVLAELEREEKGEKATSDAKPEDGAKPSPPAKNGNDAAPKASTEE